MKIGFIGLGRMGQEMAKRLIAAGHDVGVYNRTPDKLKPLTDAGATALGSIAEAARYGEAVVSMLANDAALDDVLRQSGGLLASLPKGGVHVCSGTHSVATVQAVSAAHGEAGQVMLTAPMFGRPEAVAGGTASVVAAGPADQLARFRPALEALGKKVYEAGADPTMAAAIKIANNFVLGCAIEAIGEGMSLVRKYGVEAQVLHDVMTEGMFASPAYKVYSQMIVDQKYLPAGQRAVLGLKDANLALAAGEAVGVPLPSGNVWRDRLVGALAHDEGEHDWGVMALEQARACGLV